MSINFIVLISVWSLTILGLILWVSKDRLREACLVFFFKQFMTWILGLVVVECGWIEYPVREFSKASGTSFSFEYFIYPAICVIFNLRYPYHKGKLHRIGWFLFFPTWMTILEVLIEEHTDLIEYIEWSWYWTWLTLLITFFFSMHFYRWFFKKSSLTQ
ncbi:CBO0543 family protein [Bacillus marasmi]|uniref:CBO0543 family protein n=1 Tax=Bacillus marasmi TaxID=1926279 RepID=UPI0011CBFBB4|nr:CBO0543 family protein [Bacillus marasmi]